MATTVQAKTTFLSTIGETSINVYDESLMVASGATNTILSYTVPVDSIFYLVRAAFTGGNIATYTIDIDGGIIDTKHTYWCNFSDEFNFTTNGLDKGLAVAAGSVINIKVTNFRPTAANFNARIQGVLKE